MPQRTANTVVVICGPTASGKSRLALALAQRMNGAVINADSMQVYRGLEVLTAQPDAAARAGAPHRLYGILDAADPCSAGRWRAMAVAEIDRARGRGLVPIVAGGTGLYLKALMEGIAPVPPIPAEVRARVRARHATLGDAAFHAELAARDPAGAGAVRASDPQRMIRAMEVIEATGRPLAAWQAEAADRAPAHAFRVVLLDPPRTRLHAAIEARFDRMMAVGALEEVRALAGRRLDSALPAMKALGVRELMAACRGEATPAEAAARAKAASRAYARRQGTWFRRQIIADYRYQEQFSELLCEKILSEIL
jgi:tRNA dimethylallyltransferase